MSAASLQLNNAKIMKNLKFGVAQGLNKIAKQAQAASMTAIRSTFTVRNTWSEPGNKFGIKVKGANKDNLTATVHSQAVWLLLHEEGGTKTPRDGNSIAIPTEMVKRNKRDIITRANRPKGLGAKAFVVVSSTGGRRLARFKGAGQNKTVQFLYLFVRRARIKKQSTFYVPIEKKIRRDGLRVIGAEVRAAFA